jgi:drug/metabolite transporter (DMT)-like permease
MDGFVFGAVLAAAALHAAWNTLAKGSADHFLSIMLVAIAGSVIALPVLPFLPLPQAEAWPWLLASGVIHIGYFLFLARAYRFGDLAQVYPIARGTAPLLVVLFGGGLLAETLSGTAMAGMGLLVPGLWLMTVRGGRDLSALSAPPVLAAFATAGFTAAYTIVDGIGVRASGHALSYSLWLFALFGVFMLPVTLFARGRGVVWQLLAQWRMGLGASLMVVFAYSIALWAMTRAPVTLVAALRETSVLFAAIFAALLLKEPLTEWRIVAMLLIAAGIVLLRLG